MATLEDIKAGAAVRGLTPDGVAKVVQVEWFGDQAVKVTFEDASGTGSAPRADRARPPTCA